METNKIELKDKEILYKELPANYTGDAIVKFKNNNKFIGYFENGEKKKGKLIYSTKKVSEGSYEKNKKDNKKTGIKYEKFYYGNFDKGEKKGVGFQRYANGDFYYGEWKNNRKNGKGIYFFSSTKEYFYGDWTKGNFISGFWQTNNFKYFGKFFRNKPKAHGFFSFSNELKINVSYEQLFCTSELDEFDESDKELIQLFWKQID